MPTNLLGQPLECCCLDPRTGFYRDGFCHTGPGDSGLHTVCAVMTSEFLEFARRQGNDLISPRPEYDFPGLKPGDRWCVCVTTWVQALAHGLAPPIHLAATHSSAVFGSLYARGLPHNTGLLAPGDANRRQATQSSSQRAR